MIDTKSIKCNVQDSCKSTICLLPTVFSFSTNEQGLELKLPRNTCDLVQQKEIVEACRGKEAGGPTYSFEMSSIPSFHVQIRTNMYIYFIVALIRSRRSFKIRETLSLTQRGGGGGGW